MDTGWEFKISIRCAGKPYKENLYHKLVRTQPIVAMGSARDRNIRQNLGRSRWLIRDRCRVATPSRLPPYSSSEHLTLAAARKLQANSEILRKYRGHQTRNFVGRTRAWVLTR